MQGTDKTDAARSEVKRSEPLQLRVGLGLLFGVVVLVLLHRSLRFKQPDDDRAVLRSLRELLESVGGDSDSIRSTQQAIAALRVHLQRSRPQHGTVDKELRRILAANIGPVAAQKHADPSSGLVQLLAQLPQYSSPAAASSASLYPSIRPDGKVCADVDINGRAVRRCIAPSLQVRDPTNVYVMFKTERGGGRFFYLMLEGLQNHPAVRLVGGPPYFCEDSEFGRWSQMLGERFQWQCKTDTLNEPRNVAPNNTDVALVFFPPTQPMLWAMDQLAAHVPGRPSSLKGLKCTGRCDMPLRMLTVPNTSADSNIPEGGVAYPFPVPRDRMVFLDEGDGPTKHWAVPAGHYLSYFKRSWVIKGYKAQPRVGSGLALDPSKSYFPMPYAVGDSYIPSTIAGPRDVDVVCTLRKDYGHDPKRPGTRALVLEHLAAARRSWGKRLKWQVGQASSGSRTSISESYFAIMRRAKIIVTANPGHWEIDYRLCEALSSGALVFVDQMWGPYPNMPVDGKHIVYYKGDDAEDLIGKLRYWLDRPNEARKVAVAGFEHAMKHLRGVSLADYILRSLPTQRNARRQYRVTGAAMVRHAKDKGLVPNGHMKYSCTMTACNHSFGPATFSVSL
eukprot:TRINITY_DN13196_c0_g1_i1.p1 TRINITY_DN13196_c0_g1~~TRINITY_DN13196_c0_g1_i1.p1  ORF type:complete len:618 (+),score=68.84 TRINITY_DN13196_c0_g1_i1:69-1922(+)